MPSAISEFSFGPRPIATPIFGISIRVFFAPLLYPVDRRLRILTVTFELGSDVAGLAVVAVTVLHALHLVEHVKRFCLPALTAFLQAYWPPFCTYERTKSSAFSSS